MYFRRYTGKVNMVIFDTAGTVCDGPQDLTHRWPQDDLRGCKAPVVPFYEVLSNHGVVVNWSIIRQPMGVYKPDHLRYLLDVPEVRAQYIAVHGHEYTEDEFVTMIEEFKYLLPQYSIDDDLLRPVNGAVECIHELRSAEIIICSDTGYFDSISRLVNKKLEDKYGIHFDVSTNSEIVQGRPSPFMIFDCMAKARIWPVESVVKVDDTASGILSGNYAGCWTIGVYASGSDDYDKLASAKPDFLIPSVARVPDIIFGQIEPAMRRGERPGQGLFEFPKY